LELRQWARAAALYAIPAYAVALFLIHTPSVAVVVSLAVLVWAWAFLCFSQAARKVLTVRHGQKDILIPRRPWLGGLYLVLGLLQAPAFVVLFTQGWSEAVERYYLLPASLLILTVVCGARLNLRRSRSDVSTSLA
jgi:hypothetical protein